MSTPIVRQERLALANEEVSALACILEGGDRAGYYMAYYTMTGNKEAALQAKIATFSESEGGFAFAANWLLQNLWRLNVGSLAPLRIWRLIGLDRNMRTKCRIRAFACAILFASPIVGSTASAQERLPRELPAVKYFLDEKPDNADVHKLPSSARQPFIAKVQVVSIASAIDHDRHSPTNDQILAKLRLLELYLGERLATPDLVVTFGTIGVEQNIKYPHTPAMREREYFVVSYVGEDGQRRLLGYPIIIVKTNTSNGMQNVGNMRGYGHGRSASKSL